LNDVNQQEDDRDDQQNVQRTAQCGGGYHSEQPEHDAKYHQKEHVSLLTRAYA
jgi:hypothetical protein